MAGRHVADAAHPANPPQPAPVDHLVDPGASISDGTSVTVDMEAMPTHPDVAPSPANPDALVEGGAVGDGTEME